MTGLAYRGPAGSYTDTGQAGRGPCSALAASMQPHQRDTAGWDEFGFRLESLEELETSQVRASMSGSLSVSVSVRTQERDLQTNNNTSY